jgi:hypothetical protein
MKKAKNFRGNPTYPAPKKVKIYACHVNQKGPGMHENRKT